MMDSLVPKYVTLWYAPGLQTHLAYDLYEPFTS